MDDPRSRLSIFLVIFFFIASAYCALAETAISSVSKNKIKVASEKGDSRAKKAWYVLEHFDDALTTLLICTNIAHIAAASIVTVLVTRKWGLSVVTLSTVLMTLAMFFAGEMLPKSIGKKVPEKACLACCGLLTVLMKIVWPFAKMLSVIGSVVSKASGDEEDPSVTEDELYDIIEDMAEDGDISDEQSDLISSTLQFADVTVASVLTPRVDVVGMDVNTSPEAALELIRNQNHSRILIYDGTIDRCVGVLQIRKFLKAYVRSHQAPDIRSCMDEVFFAPQSTSIDELLISMSKNKLNLTVITDSYGGTLGVVTVEDILEELVGEIWDEDDEIREPIVKLTDDTYIVDGNETVRDAFEYMEFTDPEEEENEERFTNLLMADWVYEQFARIPEQGDTFDYHTLHVSVERIDHNRIYQVKIEVLEPQEEEGKEDEEA